jgi:hypothetical protein
MYIKVSGWLRKYSISQFSGVLLRRSLCREVASPNDQMKAEEESFWLLIFFPFSFALES